MLATLLGAACLSATGAELLAAPVVTNVATFAVQVTNQLYLAVSPLTNDPFAVSSPQPTNAVADALAGGTTTNAVTAAGTVTNVPALLLLDTNRLDKAVAAATRLRSPFGRAVRANIKWKRVRRKKKYINIFPICTMKKWVRA